MRILLLDNYDSFTYNLLHLVQKVSGCTPDVIRNNALDLADVDAYDRIILSPGPGLPSEAGIMPALLRRYWRHKPVLGVCLGMQAIGELAGASLRNLHTVCHGEATRITANTSDPLFAGCPSSFLVGRYHSWVIDDANLPASLEVTARDGSGLIMAVRHRQANICGIQFHPESVLSENGDRIMANWLRS